MIPNIEIVQITDGLRIIIQFTHARTTNNNKEREMCVLFITYIHSNDIIIIADWASISGGWYCLIVSNNDNTVSGENRLYIE